MLVESVPEACGGDAVPASVPSAVVVSVVIIPAVCGILGT